MKKKLLSECRMLKMAIIIIVMSTGVVTAQKVKEKTIPIPEDINRILKTSCMPCHGDKGGRLPKIHLNFTKWTSYGPQKEADKAEEICTALKKKSMPPRERRESNPELNPTKEQIDLICNWAGSIKPAGNRKK
jgi:hypothetical protein